MERYSEWYYAQIIRGKGKNVDKSWTSGKKIMKNFLKMKKFRKPYVSLDSVTAHSHLFQTLKLSIYGSG